jgi:toxin ParE1/3/4
MTIVRRAEVIQDLEDISDALAARSPATAIRFLDAAEQTFADLEAMPSMGAVCPLQNPQMQNVRQWRVRGFSKYVVIYRPLNGGVEILRVLHGSRDLPSILEGGP